MKVKNVLIFCTCILVITGCNMPFAESPVKTAQVLSTATNVSIIPPITAYTPTTAPTVAIVDPALSTETAEVNPGECLTLLVPSEGLVYPLDKEIKFIWEAMPGAKKYLLEISNPTGWLLSIETTTTSYVVPAEIFPGTTNYFWVVVVFDSAGKQICRTGAWNFSITIKKSYPTEKPGKDDDGGSRDGPDDGNGDGGGDYDFPFPEW